ncbi:MAG: putative membrane protein [Rhodobacteraceae bacterium HLUCCA08]|nr:MAG: putative membrane protein [Rhodobacteraceae bacterium HLUCCA08]
MRPRHLVRAVLLLAALPVVFVLVAALALLGREITAPGWVREAVEARAEAVLDGGSLDFREVTITLGTDLHPRVVLRDAVLRDADGIELAQVPRIEGLISPRGVVQGRVLAQEVRVAGAQLRLRRAVDGSVGLAFGLGAEVGQAENLPALLEQVEAQFADGPLEALELVRASGLIVNFDDARARRSWTVDGGALSLDLRGGRTVLEADLSLLTGRAWASRLQLRYDSPQGARTASFGFEITDAVGSDIATQSPALAWLAVVDAPISGAMTGGLDATGALGPLEVRLSMGEGVIQAGPGTRPVPFTGAAADLTYDPQAGRIGFERLAVDSAWGLVEARGRTLLEGMRLGWPEALVGQFEIDRLVLTPPEAYPEPLVLDAVSLEARMQLDPFALELGEAVLRIDGEPLVLRGTVRAAAEGWGVALDGRIDTLAWAEALRLWPRTLRPGTRDWFARNVEAGRLRDAALSLRLPPAGRPVLGLTADLEDAQVRFARTLPPVEAAGGRLSWIGGRLALVLERGHLTAPQGGRIDLAGSVMEVPRTGPQAPARFDLALSGTITAMLAVLNEPPFEVLRESDLPVTLADGRAVLELALDMPLKPGTTRDERDWQASGTLSGLRSALLVPGRVLTAAALQVMADPDALVFAGPVRVSDVPADLTYARALGPDSAGTGRIEGTVTLSAASLAAFGIGLPPGMVRGQGTARVDIDLSRPGAPGLRLRSDLAGLGLALEGLGWAKPRGATGRFELDGVLGDAPRIDRIVLDASGLDMAGRLDLAPGGGLARARFDRVQLGGWLDSAVTLVARGPGAAPRIELTGGMLDLRRLPGGGGASGQEGGPVVAALDRVQVTDTIALTGFRGEFSRLGGFSGTFTAAVNGQAPIAGTLIPTPRGAAVRLLSGDAGAVLRATGLLPGARSGALELVLQPTGAPGTFDGQLAASNLRVRDAPALASLLDAISVVGLLSQLDGQGLLFNDVEALFRITPRQIVITRSSAVGPGLGLSLDGVHDLASGRVDFQGVVSPFYLLNGVGAVLTRPGEGLIGFSFTLQGPVDSPRVLVNPLSVLTPGMFREIFRRPPPSLAE